MQPDNTTFQKLLHKDMLDFVIRIGLVAFVVIMSARIFAPFTGLVLWAFILAVALYPLHRIVARRLGGRQGGAATLLVLAGLLVVGLPTVMLGSSFAGQIHDAYKAFENNTITIKQPAASVADWPLIGKKVYGAWSAAADNLPAFLEKNRERLRNIAKRAFSAAANTAGSVLLFLGSLIIAGIMLAYGESGSQAMQRILNRLTGPTTGPRLHSLTSATIRSVATGVIGVAFIQSLLLGIGFMIAGIPAAGVLALIVLLFGIAQLPAALISLPAIAYMWWAGDASTTFNIVMSIYLLVAGLADNVLKPLMLGRGVDVPMPVILIGAIGGMVSAGIIGLFIGAVLLAVGYQVFMDWVDEGEKGTSADAA